MPKDSAPSRARKGEPGVVIAWIAMGGNQGDVLATFARAITLLDNTPLVRARRHSPCYRTQPVGCAEDAPWFHNAVLEVITRLSPRDLLKRLQAVERVCGRRRRGVAVNAPRTLDLDLLLHGDTVLEAPGLILPHPRLHLRRFVLQPLADLAPELVHPVLGKRVDTLLRDVEDDAVVILVT